MLIGVANACAIRVGAAAAWLRGSAFGQAPFSMAPKLTPLHGQMADS
jgi:hypothetical protein